MRADHVEFDSSLLLPGQAFEVHVVDLRNQAERPVELILSDIVAAFGEVFRREAKRVVKHVHEMTMKFVTRVGETIDESGRRQGPTAHAAHHRAWRYVQVALLRVEGALESSYRVT